MPSSCDKRLGTYSTGIRLLQNSNCHLIPRYLCGICGQRVRDVNWIEYIRYSKQFQFDDTKSVQVMLPPEVDN